jgi:hypothetical protein
VNKLRYLRDTPYGAGIYECCYCGSLVIWPCKLESLLPPCCPGADVGHRRYVRCMPLGDYEQLCIRLRPRHPDLPIWIWEEMWFERAVETICWDRAWFETWAFMRRQACTK